MGFHQEVNSRSFELCFTGNKKDKFVVGLFSYLFLSIKYVEKQRHEPVFYRNNEKEP